jgi:hypothetical protein
LNISALDDKKTDRVFPAKPYKENLIERIYRVGRIAQAVTETAAESSPCAVHRQRSSSRFRFVGCCRSWAEAQQGIHAFAFDRTTTGRRRMNLQEETNA